MIKIAHFDDGKGKYASHELSFKFCDYNDEDCMKSFNDIDAFVTNLALDEIRVYGKSIEDAFESLDTVMDWLFERYKEIYKAYKNGEFKDNIVEVDCMGKEI